MHALVNPIIRNAFRNCTFFAQNVANASSTPAHKKPASVNKEIVLPRAALKPNVAQFQDRLADTYFSMLLPAYMTPSILVPWMAITETPVVLSPVALTVILTALSVTADLSLQIFDIKNEAKRSLIKGSAGPANEKHPKKNEIARMLLASKNPDITFGTHEVIIKGQIASPTPTPDAQLSSSAHP
jgi:hypothetical protein